MAPKILVKERFTDGEIDLSMSDLEDVPVKEIMLLKKAYSLDLSNNRISILPKNFSTLTHLTKLDLSKNELKSLPEDFGNLSKLKYLDLYCNQLNHLPLSLCKLRELKWLDLKDNPLVPKVAKIAGPCLDTKQCQNCARDIVNFFVKLEEQVNAELEVRNKTRQKQLEINQQKKQVEKKEKKKVKQKQKQETLVQKSNGNINKTKKDKKNEPKNVPEKSQKSSFIVEAFKCFLITGLILFLITSTQMKSTKHVELFTKNMYKKSLDALPANLKPYGIQFGTMFNGVHKKTGNIILGVVRYLDKYIPERKRNEFLQNLTNIFNGLVKKISDFYEHFVQSK